MPGPDPEPTNYLQQPERQSRAQNRRSIGEDDNAKERLARQVTELALARSGKLKCVVLSSMRPEPPLEAVFEI